MTDITALGELLIDFTENGTSPSKMRLFEQNPGGAPANVLACAARLGAHTAFIGKVGNDMHGLFLKQTLQNLSVDTAYLYLSDEAFTTLAFVALNEDGERTFSFARKPGADTLLHPDELPEALLRDTAILAIGTLALSAEPAASAQRRAVRIARENNALVALDVNYRASLWESEERAVEATLSMMPFVDVLKTSCEEAEMLTGDKDPNRSGAKLLAMGPRLVAVTLGEKGAWLMNASSSVFLPAFPVKSVDTTGAGDAFWGALLVMLLKHGKDPEVLSSEDLAELLRFAEASGACCATKRGAIPAMPTFSEIKSLVNG